MDKKEEFKNFMKNHPELISNIKEKKNTWQEYYELYDIYGEEDAAWEKYKEVDRTNTISELTSLVKNINMDNVQKYINNAQKAINVIQELTTKTPTEVPKIIPKTPRPINKFFGD